MPDTAIHYHGSYLMPSLEHATVADAMHPGILSCEPDATLTDVARMMASNHIHCLAVIGVSHREPECGIWGIISDLDLIRAGIRGGEDTSAGALAQQSIVSVTPTTSLRDAGELMVTHGANHLVVVEAESQRPVGILSTLDIAGVLAWGEG
ncbi:MAG: CBS domain-containing protein [Solirubrobacterales bacterium]|nr:CBS domain-containing protein [Solirubrobacterales bacterium]MBV9309827.1 CBS domain-containing protein [Solirubrobacterales bacterium]